MPGLHQIRWPTCRVDCNLNGAGSIISGYSCSDPVPSIDALRERCPVLRCVVGGHHPQPQVVKAIFGECQTNEPATVLRHEIDRFGSSEFRRDGEVAFVLPVFIVHDHDHAALPNFSDSSLDVSERTVHDLHPKK